MAKIKKKGTSGQAKNFVTRTQAVRKLQISLPDFRRLCIFKGVYPREPRNKKKASKSATASTTFYYTRDIQYLLHEPLLRKFREQKALAKKIARALGRGEVGEAARLEKNHAPKFSLEHIIKERYPTFVDAVRDLDDALSLLFLFANLPSSANAPPKTIARCQRLCLEFQHYLITTNSLRKSFLSIKGIYYQATIQGQDILWLVPYRFVQQVTGDVDFRIMATFVEFYTTLLGFVNFRLYTSIGLVYPPKFDVKSDERGAELAAFKLEGRKVGEQGHITQAQAQENAMIEGDKTVLNDIQARVDTILERTQDPLEKRLDQEVEEAADADDNDKIDSFEPLAPEADTLPQPDTSKTDSAILFAPFTFFVSRETPRGPIEFLLRAFGCKRIGWDAILGDGAFTNDELDPRITHQIVDRPPLPESALPPSPHNPQEGTNATPRLKPGARVPGRTYIQPQWVWDSVNECKLLRPDLYAPGTTLPPHLSPWVKPSKGEYDPRLPLAEQEEEEEAERAAEREELDEEQEEDVVSGDDDGDVNAGIRTSSTSDTDADSEKESLNGGMDVAGSEDETDGSEDDAGEDEFEGFEEDVNATEEPQDEAEASRTQHQKELEAEASGLPYSTSGDIASEEVSNVTKKPGALSRKHVVQRKKEQEELERRKMMMSRKKRKLFEKMQYSNQKKDEAAEKLRQKRRKIEKQLK